MRNPKRQIPKPKSEVAVGAVAGLFVLFASLIAAQAPSNPTFEVASIKANRSGAPLQILPTLQPGGRVFAINLPLREFIQVAYSLRDNQLIVGSPLAEARFDLEARASAGTTPEQAAAMLRGLLIDRFSLKTHGETRQLPVYTLERVNATRLGTQIKPAGPECAPLTIPSGPGAPPPPPPPPPSLAGSRLGPREDGAKCPSMFFPGTWSLRSMSMRAFVLALERLVRRAVVDGTALAGEFDFDLTYTPESFEVPFAGNVIGGAVGGPEGFGPGPLPRTGPSVFTALRDQLGLRLEAGRAPVNVVVVDDVRQPSEN
jgi:uncharacterized protein (TIGR03435 family)